MLRDLLLTGRHNKVGCGDYGTMCVFTEDGPRLDGCWCRCHNALREDQDVGYHQERRRAKYEQLMQPSTWVPGQGWQISRR